VHWNYKQSNENLQVMPISDAHKINSFKLKIFRKKIMKRYKYRLFIRQRAREWQVVY